MDLTAAVFPCRNHRGSGLLGEKDDVLILIGPGCFARWAGWAEAGLATAGTATEQLVGLGIPAVSLPGPGPQFQVCGDLLSVRAGCWGAAVRPCRIGTPKSLPSWLNDSRSSEDEALRTRLGLHRTMMDGLRRDRMGLPEAVPTWRGWSWRWDRTGYTDTDTESLPLSCSRPACWVSGRRMKEMAALQDPEYVKLCARLASGLGISLASARRPGGHGISPAGSRAVERRAGGCSEAAGRTGLNQQSRTRSPGSRAEASHLERRAIPTSCSKTEPSAPVSVRRSG